MRIARTLQARGPRQMSALPILDDGPINKLFISVLYPLAMVLICFRISYCVLFIFRTTTTTKVSVSYYGQ